MMSRSPAEARTIVRQIVDATMEIIGEQGFQAVTHRAVAKHAGVSLGAISHHFPSRDALLRGTLRHAATLEVARLERLALDLQTRAFEVEEWTRAMATALANDLERNPVRHLGQYELLLACARDPELRDLARDWREAHLRVAEVGLRAAGTAAPEAHAHLLVAAITGLLLKQLAYPARRFGSDVLEPLLRELVFALANAPITSAAAWSWPGEPRR